MCYTVSAENLLTWALLRKRNEGVSITFIRRISELVQTSINDCTFDVSASSLYAVVEDSEMFEWSNNVITFSNSYTINMQKVRSSLEYRMPSQIIDALDSCKI